MFKRRDSQKKPTVELLMDFKSSFPHLSRPCSSSAVPGSRPLESDHHGFEDLAFDSSDFPDHHDQSSYVATTHGFESMVSPTAIDPVSMNYADVNHSTDFWPPTPAAQLLYGESHGEAHKDHYHYPTGMGMDTPVSASTSNPQSHASRSHSLNLNDSLFRSRAMSIQNSSTFNQNQSFPPHAFDFAMPQSGSGYISSFPQGLRMSDISYDTNQYSQHQSLSTIRNLPNSSAIIDSPTTAQASSQFRFQVILKAPTAMVKHAGEVPVTYLNKCQTYAISIADTMPQHDFNYQLPRYRTCIRIAFEDENQRRKPETCWKLWRNGRGKDEAYKRGGRFLAVEYARPDANHGDQRSNIDITNESFDGFSFYWTPTPGSMPECTVQARFNFLSTDFSLSKGVKGVPVRLCAKTEIVTPEVNTMTNVPTREISYCSVKTFRDHGSERKLANDRAHVKKSIEKAQQQLEQADAGAKANGKRRRSDSTTGERPRKMTTHQRAMSVSSDSSFGQDLGEDESRTKLRMLESMPQSIKPVSRLYLKGQDQDDLDTYPVQLSGDPPEPGLLSSSGPPSLRRDSTNTTTHSSIDITAASSHSPSIERNRQNAGMYPTPPQLPSQRLPGSRHSDHSPASHLGSDLHAQQLASPPPSGSTNMPKDKPCDSNLDVPAINVVDLDSSYVAPPEAQSRPVACLYVKPTIAGAKLEDDSYRAIYLKQRTVDDFISNIATKVGVDAASVTEILRVNERGLQIKVDDEMIQQMSEGQDLLAAFDHTEQYSLKTEQFLDGHDSTTQHVGESGTMYRLTLRY